MALYLDTSCLLKLFLLEPESMRVATTIASEARVIVSSLARLEAVVQFQALYEGGRLTRRAATGLANRLETMLANTPYELVSTSADVAVQATAQILPLGVAPHCRSADRLHLAIMQQLKLNRLFTNDRAQAAAARQLGFEVVSLD